MLLELYQSGLLRTPQLLWVFGYLSAFMGLFFAFLEGYHRGWRLKYLYLGTALHYLFVSVWAASFVLSDGMPKEMSNLMISGTTIFMVFGLGVSVWQWFKGKGVL